MIPASPEGRILAPTMDDFASYLGRRRERRGWSTFNV